MTEYKTIKQDVDSPEVENNLEMEADSVLNHLISQGWTVDSMSYQPWQDGRDFYTRRYVTLKREPVEAARISDETWQQRVQDAYLRGRNHGYDKAFADGADWQKTQAPTPDVTASTLPTIIVDGYKAGLIRTIEFKYFFDVKEAADFYVELGGHGAISHTVGGYFKDCPDGREKDPAWLVEVFVAVPSTGIKDESDAS